jgi:TolB-like protein/Flp pilus assembly protein TadD
VSNESEKQYANDRERLLDEIRRRAEEAELKRLEEEEKAQRGVPEPPPLDEEPFTPPEPPPIAPVPEAPVHPEEPDIEPRAILDEARELYQYERYDKALALVEKVLAVFPGLGEANKLHEEIQRAKTLADVVRQEEARHRERHLQPLPPPPPPDAVPSSQRPESDFWGTPKVDQPIDGLPGDVHEIGPPKPSSPPLLDRTVAKLARAKARVKIPVKPILIGSAALVTVLVAYIIIENLVTAVVPPQRILLIMPASPATPDEAGLLMADGLTESLIQAVGRAPGVQVIAPASSFNSRTTSVRPQQLARLLSAGYVLTWTVQQSEQSVVCSVALMDTSGNAPVWKSSFESLLPDLPSHLRALARAIVEAMRVELPTDNDPLALQGPPVPVLSYGQYLQAVALARSSAPNALSRASELLQLVVQTDSMWGEGWSALGWVSMLAMEQNPDAPRSDAVMSLTYVQKAITRGARLAEAFRVWGMIETLNGNYLKAIERYQNSVELCPGDADAQKRLAMIWMLRGKKEEAQRAITVATQCDPLNPDVIIMRGLIQQFQGDARGAEQSYTRAMQLSHDQNDTAAELHMDVLISLQRADDAFAAATDMAARRRDDPLSHYRLGRIAQVAGQPIPQWQGMFQQTLELINQRLRTAPDDPAMLVLQALTYTRLGQRKDALDADARALRVAPGNLNALYGTARMYALQRDQKQAAAYLSQAVDKRYDLGRIMDIDLYNLRADQDFIRAITR